MLLIYLVLGILFLVLGAVVLGGLIRDVSELIQALPAYANALGAWLMRLSTTLPVLPNVDLSQWFANTVATIVSWGLSQAQGVLQVVAAVLRLLGSLLNVLFILMMALYLTVDGERMRDYVLVFAPPVTSSAPGEWCRGPCIDSDAGSRGSFCCA